MNTKRVLVTGASGFVGSCLIQSEAFDWIPWTIRNQVRLPEEHFEQVVHCAGLAHQMQGAEPRKYFEINRDKTLQLASQAKQAGAKQFVFLSTTKVLGEGRNGEVYDEKTPCEPADPYGQSKLEAEQALRNLQNDDFVVSIIRPPLVFGPGVKGNFIRLIQLCDSITPLPFGAANSQRSMVYVGNLIALIEHVLNHTIGGTFFAGDSDPIQIRELVTLLRGALGRPERLLSVPSSIVTLMRYIAPHQVSRLFDGFVINNTFTNKMLGFEPPHSTRVGIAATVDWYQRRKDNKQS